MQRSFQTWSFPEASRHKIRSSPSNVAATTFPAGTSLLKAITCQSSIRAASGLAASVGLKCEEARHHQAGDDSDDDEDE